MAKGHIEKRHQSSYTLIIDEGLDPETGTRKRWAKSVKTDDEGRLAGSEKDTKKANQ